MESTEIGQNAVRQNLRNDEFLGNRTKRDAKNMRDPEILGNLTNRDAKKPPQNHDFLDNPCTFMYCLELYANAYNNIATKAVKILQTLAGIARKP